VIAGKLADESSVMMLSATVPDLMLPSSIAQPRPLLPIGRVCVKTLPVMLPVTPPALR
jgi:hypothetical protein